MPELDCWPANKLCDLPFLLFISLLECTFPHISNIWSILVILCWCYLHNCINSGKVEWSDPPLWWHSLYWLGYCRHQRKLHKKSVSYPLCWMAQACSVTLEYCTIWTILGEEKHQSWGWVWKVHLTSGYSRERDVYLCCLVLCSGFRFRFQVCRDPFLSTRKTQKIEYMRSINIIKFKTQYVHHICRA